MSNVAEAPAITCPAFCYRVHDERSGDVVSHETRPIRVDQLPGEGEPVLLQAAQHEGDMAPLLYVGSYTFDPAGARQLLASVSALVSVMEGASR